MPTISCPACRTTVSVPADVGPEGVICGACRETIRPDAAGTQPPPASETDGPPAPASGTYPVTQFVAGTGGSPAGLVVAGTTGLIGAVLLAILCAILHSFFWLVIVFPIFHGLAVGVATGLGGRLAKVRLRVALGAVAAVCAILSVLGIHFLGYLAVVANPAAPPIGFLEYMDLHAQEGVRIGKAGAGNKSNLGYTGTIIYWAVEALVTAVAAALIAGTMVTSPFCEACNAWKKKRTFGPYRVEPTSAAPAVAVGVPAGIVAPAEGQKKVTLSVYVCPHCGEEGTIDVLLEGAHVEGKQTTNYRVFMTYPGEALAAFEQAGSTCREHGLATR